MRSAGYRKRSAVLALWLAGWGVALAGPYTETGIPGNSPSILGWATGVVSVNRGPVDITVPGGAKATYGDASSALGPADATSDNPYPVISLGDGGSITLSFSIPIANGPGADFAVFENAFTTTGGSYSELAFVEVSSNGTDFFRFPSVSLTQTTTQVGSFGVLDPTDIHNLAGKDVAGVGTLFDLSDLGNVGGLLLDLNSIRYVRLVDVVGSIDPLYATKDSLGNVINDPWKTNFTTGGFDLDAVAVLNTVPEPSVLVLLALGGGFAVARSRRRYAGR
jgi:hypothetical protein